MRRLRDWSADVLNLPATLSAQWQTLRELAQAVDTISEQIEELRASLRAPLRAPVLATLTMLCERRVHVESRLAGVQPEVHWIGTVIGGEHWMHVGDDYELVLQPHYALRNFRWFLSGDPSVVVTDVKIGPTSVISGQGGQKFGDAQTECELGSYLRVTLARRQVPS